MLLITSAASMGLYTYKTEVGCEDVTPKLDDNIKMINAKQKELVNMKDRINLEWVSGKWIPFCSNLCRNILL